MLSDLQGGKPFLSDLEDGRGFLSHIGFGVMVAGLEQFSTLLLTQGDVESFGHEGPFWKKHIAQNAPIGVLYQRYAPAILTYIRRHISSPEDAEDLLVEVFLAALERNNLLCLNEGEQLAWLR